MRKLLPSLLIAIMALSVLSCAGVVSAAQPKAIVHPLVIGPSTPQYYPVTAAPGNNYYFYPGGYNYYGTSLYKTLPGVVQATANPNNGNLYAYESTKAIYTYQYAEALNGVNLQINAPTTGATATYATITVRMKAAFVVQVANPANAYGEMGMLATNSYQGFTYGPYFYPWFTTPGNGRWTTNQAMTLGFTINNGPFVGWDTGSVQTVGGYLMSTSTGTTGTVSAQGQVQSIEIQFS